MACQSDEEPERGWVKAIHEGKYPLISEDSVYLITLSNNPKQSIHVNYDFKPEDGIHIESRYFAMKPGLANGSQWSYTIEGCTVAKYNKRFLNDVPSDEVKHWQITKTSTHLIIKCNKVTVLDFKFDHDCDQDKRNGHQVQVWSRNLEPEIMIRMFDCDCLLTMK